MLLARLRSGFGTPPCALAAAAPTGFVVDLRASFFVEEEEDGTAVEEEAAAGETGATDAATAVCSLRTSALSSLELARPPSTPAATSSWTAASSSMPGPIQLR